MCTLRRTEEGGSWNSLGLVEPLIVDLVESAKKWNETCLIFSFFYTVLRNCTVFHYSPLQFPPIPYHPTAEEEETELFIRSPLRKGRREGTNRGKFVAAASCQGRKGRDLLGASTPRLINHSSFPPPTSPNYVRTKVTRLETYFVQRAFLEEVSC